ncbi:hypothetical protein [Streptosporangium pseudovulgare]|uniref:Uncharacterized protein n=1 Tax=Streptosporangium pseudovulgare TaxID=35765 RepID=A0ABQ2R4A3_9ACTN|nr:hypothetical protein [Streptosporangium pseudovulgare]GGQ09316.1 hypothetical protein GCM10010140_44370 [Streptosporangium pseudovulgare]
MNEHAAPEEAAEGGGGPMGEDRDPTGEDHDPAGKHHGGTPDDPPPAPRGIDGESRVVAERSAADTTFPDRPLLADLPSDDPGDLLDGAAPGPGPGPGPEEGMGAGEGAGKRTPEPEMGPAS